jgi:hypothetical protein
MAAYSQPAFGIIHRLREIEDAGITENNPIANTEIAYLYDGRLEAFTFDGSAADHYLRFDYGATPDATDRLVIPSGHNLGTYNITLKAADSADMLTNPTTLLSSVTVAAGVIDEAFASNSQRYGELSFDDTGTWSMPEIWLTKRREPVFGHVWPWTDSFQFNTLDFIKPSGDIATLEQGAKQRIFRMSWEGLLLVDYDIFDDLFTECGRTKPFLFWPPYGEDPLIVKLLRDPEYQPGARVPGNAESRNVTLDFIELIG